MFSSAEGFGAELWEFISIFGPRNGIPSCLSLPGRVRNGIPRFSVPRNNWNSVGNNHLFRLFRLPRDYFFVGNPQPYTRVVQEGDRRCKKSTLNDLAYLTPLKISLINPVLLSYTTYMYLHSCSSTPHPS